MDEEEGNWTDGSGYPFKVGTNQKLWKKNYLHFVFPWGNNSKIKKNVSVDQVPAKINHDSPIHFNKVAQSVRTAKKFLQHVT